jgi:16S rRNA (uracil1498-N3)-methyltransferase
MMHRFFVEVDQIVGDSVSFREGQAHQIGHVLRLRVRDRVQVFDGKTPCDRVVELSGPQLGRIVDEAPQAAEPRTRLVVYPALLQRDKFEPVLQKLTEVGVAAIVPIFTSRGLVREAPDEKRSWRWQAILREAAEQCGRGTVPELCGALPLDAAVAGAEGTRIIAYEGEQRVGLRKVLASRPGAVSVFVGPEGGFAEAEVSRARTLGAVSVTLGPRILRTETASPILAALVLYELGDLR